MYLYLKYSPANKLIFFGNSKFDIALLITSLNKLTNSILFNIIIIYFVNIYKLCIMYILLKLNMN